MAINWQDIITAVGGQGTFLLVAAWLIRTVLADRMSRDAETFKMRLKADGDTEIERLKSSLQLIAVEHQVRFSKLHEKRAEVIAELYERLVDTFWVGTHFMLTGANPSEQDRREKYNKTLERINDFALFVDTHRIYLPEGICTQLDQYVDDVRKTVIPVGVWGTMPLPNAEAHKQRVDAIMKAFLEFEDKIPKARRALESEFRAILGDQPDKHSDNPTKSETPSPS